MFLDAAIQVAAAGVLTLTQAKEMESLAFDWIINGEKHADSRFPELAPLRERVGSVFEQEISWLIMDRKKV